MKRFEVVILWVLLLSLAGCRSSTKTTIVVYSPHGKEMLGEFERRYETLHPDQDVQWLDMGSQDAYDRIRTERDNPQADVWWGAPASIFERAEKEGLLERYRPSWHDAIPAERRSANEYWYGTFITPEVIMYNSRALPAADAPRDWDDLLDPRWKGKIIIRYPLASGTMRTIFSALIQRENARTGDSLAGFQWLQRLDANTRSYVADPTQLYLRIAREEALLTLWDLPDVQLQMETHHQPFGFVVPESGTPMITDGIAVVKGARHSDAAKAFYEFVTSKESIELQASEFYRLPARSDIPPEELPEWIRSLHLTPMQVNWEDMSAHEKQWMRYWDEHVKGRGKELEGAK